jgi:CAAX prenyl protease-like protein
MGVAVFAIWIGPDLIFPGYHAHWLFSNSLTGSMAAGMPESGREDLAVLTLRTLRAAVFVPIAEELFWRAWLMRWIVSPDFEKVPLGAWSARAFWIVAVLFASEHGVLWDVGLAAGVLYNWWMLRTKSLGDLILAHGITNACLSAYVIFAGRWEYW